MVGPYKTVDEAVKCMLYWQKRALEAEKNAEEDADNIEMYVDMILMEREAYNNLVNRHLELQDEYEILDDFFIQELDHSEMVHDQLAETIKQRDYYKQQFLDEDKELREALKVVSQMYNKARRALQPKEDSGTEESDDPWKYRS